MTRALIDEHRGRRTYASLSRAIGETDRWVSNLVTHRAPPEGKLPTVDQINRLAGELNIPAARLLLTIAMDSGLADLEVTPESIAMGSAFRALSPERQHIMTVVMRVLAGEVSA